MKQKLSVKSTLLVAAFGCLSFTVYAADDTAPADRGPDNARRQEMIKRFDANGDGKLDATERQAAKSAMEERRGDGPRDGVAGKMRERALDRFDTDGDGKISESERAAGEAAMRADIVNRPRAMARVDTDGDGQVSDAEWAAAREQMRDRMGPGGSDGPGKGPGKGKGPDGERPKGQRLGAN